MVSGLSLDADDCTEKATECERKAATAASKPLRSLYLELADKYRLIAFVAKRIEHRARKN